jgi:hypothetical protein
MKKSYAELYAQAKEAGELKRLAPKLIKFEEGVTIIGKYVQREIVPSKNEEIPDSYRYVVDTDDGLVSFFTSNAFDKSQGSVLEEGKIYAFVNNGKIPWKESQTMWDIACYLLTDKGEEVTGSEEE